jgi:CheY-like chemotaxis protein
MKQPGTWNASCDAPVGNVDQANGCHPDAFGRGQGENAAADEKRGTSAPTAEPAAVAAEPDGPVPRPAASQSAPAVPERSDTETTVPLPAPDAPIPSVEPAASTAEPATSTAGANADPHARPEQTLLDWLGHELRNPIAAIQLAVHSLRQLGEERLDQPLAILERQSTQLSNVVLELLEMARAVSQPPAIALPFRHPSWAGDEDPFRFPVREPRGSEAPRPTRLASGTVPLRQRLLLVEDNEDLSDLLADLLAAWGFEVVVARNASSALARAAVRPPDVALIDIGLPDRDGCEVARALRRSLPGSVRLIAMSGYGQRQDGARALSAGFDEYLVKPLNTARLRRLLGESPSLAIASTGREK